MDATDTDRAVDAIRQLEALADDLTGRGFDTHLIQDGGRARLSVAHRSVSQLSEHIYIAPTREGRWWFWWSWGDQLAPITAGDTAAFKIAYVLTPASVAEQVRTP